MPHMLEKMLPYVLSLFFNRITLRYIRAEDSNDSEAQNGTSTQGKLHLRMSFPKPEAHALCRWAGEKQEAPANTPALSDGHLNT